MILTIHWPAGPGERFADGVVDHQIGTQIPVRIDRRFGLIDASYDVLTHARGRPVAGTEEELTVGTIVDASVAAGGTGINLRIEIPDDKVPT